MAAEQGLHHYDSVSRTFHWTMAALVLGLMALGLAVDAFPRDWERGVVQVHVAFGAITLLLLVLRVAWRLTHAAPPVSEAGGALMALLAKVGHLGLYVVVAAVLVAGLATAFSRGLPIDFGIFSIPSPIAADRALARPTKEVHELLSWALMAMVAVHAAAAVWHERVLRDGTMQRMLGPRTP
ncbi:cytochrome b/b6 domain-containing protein [Alsobacter sp. SYSU M60028]|uniref:Cytochrome b/b6 domain-containing protein n=1 Tax=Alsobacter ponti TaxID=2962936 RepID=A0ABT1LFM3_9HYPH|nr:cytochrome b/b6 domain-containing protein [Alsobacter ponti]MCP8940297.1 cytochrome b/b6 domain-containing protein [Alsobacter ponti]